MENKLCYCGSKLLFDNCCNQFISGKLKVPTALLLMKSRYSAFATSNAEYLNSTSIIKQDSHNLAAWAKENDWKSLEILAFTNGTEKDQTGTVTFKALYINSQKQLIEHIEKSDFLQINHKWMYDKGEVDVKIIKNEKNSVGRNDKCTCGSGEKYKKCCG